MPVSSATQEQVQQRLDRRERELSAARLVSQALFQHLDVDALVEKALHIALEVVDAQAGCVLLADPAKKELYFSHAIGEKPPPRGTSFPWANGIAGSVFQSGETIITGEVKADSRHFHGIDEATGFKTHDMIAIPLKGWEGDAIGVLEVLNKRSGQLDLNDVDILAIISAFTAISIEEARLFEEAKLAEVVRVLGDVGHDMKNLLMPVLCGASLLKTEVDEFFEPLPTIDMAKANASHQMCLEVIEMVETNARRIQDRVKEIADCVKGLSAPPKFAPCKIADVVKDVNDTLRFVASEKGITLAVDGLDDLPEIQGDERRLFNAFYNLVHNALSEVPTGGSITVRSDGTANNGEILLAVSDTGKGMPPEIRESLFSSAAVSSKAGGTGLGTKIVKDVIEAHHGRIQVESEVGVGTTFHIRLPLNPV